MRKKNILLIFIISIGFSASAQSRADSLLNFIKVNKARASLYLLQNDTLVAQFNETRMMPLASTVKILVAIEFAKQAAKNIIDENELVALADLDKYYLPNTDGDAHPGWIAYEKSKAHIKNDSVLLIDVARGMIMFSSNANTEYLMDLVGLDNVQSNITQLGLTQHSAIYPLVASLFMYQNSKKKNENDILKGIRNLSEEQYCRYIYDMHKALKFDTLLKSKFRPQDLTMNMQKAWSDRLPASTTKDYVRICNVLNNRAFFDEDTYNIIQLVLEAAMENPINKSWLTHFGEKGGSTAWVLTKALYGTTKKGKRIEMAYFFDNLTEAESEMIQSWMNPFEIKILTNEDFRKKAGDVLK
jgi:D-alanyl-D-alanine carboxypeptidase